MGKEALRIASTALAMLSGMMYQVALKTDYWLSTSNTNANSGLQAIKYHSGLYYQCKLTVAQGQEQCERQPNDDFGAGFGNNQFGGFGSMNQNNFNSAGAFSGAGEGAFMLMKILSFTAVTFIWIGFMLNLSAQDTITLVNTESKNKTLRIAGAINILAAAFVLTVGIVFYTKENNSIHSLEMSTGLYLSWLTAAFLIIAGVVSFLGSEERYEETGNYADQYGSNYDSGYKPGYQQNTQNYQQDQYYNQQGGQQTTDAAYI